MDTSTLFDVKVLSPLQWHFLNSNADIREKGKVVLVTGGAKGIGRMISEGFVTNGAKVYISSRDAKACEQACKEMNALGN
jgi:NADP-dependent 3-hydroxy acid dehydrogenase YdfG